MTIHCRANEQVVHVNTDLTSSSPSCTTTTWLVPDVGQVSKMRVDMIRGSMAAPESMMRILSDYPPPPEPLGAPPPSM